MGLQQIKKIQIGEQVYEQMRTQIINGEWKPGEKIPSENALMKIFGVSRVTVRQAIQKLAGEVLVETRRGEGSFVCAAGIDNFFKTSAPLFHLGTQETREIFEFRIMFEGGTVGIAAKKISDDQIRELEENYEELKDSIGNKQRFVTLDLEFHNLLCKATGNTLANQIFQSYEPILHPAIENMVEVIGMDNGLKYHKLIIQALRKKDAKLAQELMIKHLETNMEIFEESLREKMS